jgi:hypothetical protein
LVELGEVRRRHLHGTQHGRLLVQRQRRGDRLLVVGVTPDTLQDPLDIKACLGLALGNDAFDDLQRLLLQQLQDAHVLLRTAPGSVLPLQRLTQFGEHGGQVPAPKDVGVIQRRRPPVQVVQVMLGHQELLVPPIGARMGSDHLTPQYHVDTVHVGLDGHLLEGGRAGHTVAVGSEAHHLVLVHQRRLEQARIEGSARK